MNKQGMIKQRLIMGVVFCSKKKPNFDFKYKDISRSY